jgi:hypothetical protein
VWFRFGGGNGILNKLGARAAHDEALQSIEQLRGDFASYRICGVVSPAVFAAASCTRTFTLCDYPGKGTSSNRRLINRKGNALYSTTGFGLSRVQNEPQAREPSGTALASSGLLVGWLKLRVCKAQARWQGERAPDTQNNMAAPDQPNMAFRFTSLTRMRDESQPVVPVF